MGQVDKCHILGDCDIQRDLNIQTVCSFSLCLFHQSTRVMWTPPLRESFAYPFLILQMLLLTYILR